MGRPWGNVERVPLGSFPAMGCVGPLLPDVTLTVCPAVLGTRYLAQVDECLSIWCWITAEVQVSRGTEWKGEENDNIWFLTKKIQF